MAAGDYLLEGRARDAGPRATALAAVHAGLNTDVDVLSYAAAADTLGQFRRTMPPFYSNGDVTLNILWSAEISITGNVGWDFSFMGMGAGGNINTFIFDTVQSLVADSASAAAGVILYDQILILRANLDNIIAGEDFIMQLVRDTTVAGNMAGNAELIAFNFVEA